MKNAADFGVEPAIESLDGALPSRLLHARAPPLLPGKLVMRNIAAPSIPELDLHLNGSEPPSGGSVELSFQHSQQLHIG
jgi:hypothetical protein